MCIKFFEPVYMCVYVCVSVCVSVCVYVLLEYSVMEEAFSLTVIYHFNIFLLKFFLSVIKQFVN